MTQNPAKARKTAPVDSAALPSRLFLLARITSEGFADNFYGSALKEPVGLTIDIAYREGVPKDEPKRTEYYAGFSAKLCSEIVQLLSQTSRIASTTIQGECFQVLRYLIQLRQRSTRTAEYPPLLKWRTQLQGFGFECYGLMLEIVPALFPRIGLEPIHCAIKLLQNDKNKDYSVLAERLYRFLASALSDPVVSDLLTQAQLRDLSECIARDVARSSKCYVQTSAACCLIILLQMQAMHLKAESKNVLFSSLITAIRSKLRASAERKLVVAEVQLCWRLYGAISALLLSCPVHLGIINICETVFEEGLKISDLDVQISCRSGLQVVSTLLRPRVPKEVVDNFLRTQDSVTEVVLLNDAAVLPKKRPSAVVVPSGPLDVATEEIPEPVLKKSAPMDYNVEQTAPLHEISQSVGSADAPEEALSMKVDECESGPPGQLEQEKPDNGLEMVSDEEKSFAARSKASADEHEEKVMDLLELFHDSDPDMIEGILGIRESPPP